MSVGIDGGHFKVWIASIDSSAGDGKPAIVHGTKGIRAARNVLGDRLGSTLVRSKATYEAALEELPQLLGSTDRQEQALDAARAAETESLGVLGCAVASEGASPENAAGDAGSIRVYKVFVHEDTGDQAEHPGANVLEKEALLVEDVVATESGNPFTLEAVTHALVAMATADGNPSIATTYAGSYRRHGDSDLWTEVQDLLEHTFPVDPS